MNNSKKMTEIIEKKKELSQEKTPKYGTRKLSIGLVSCMLGFSLIIAPGSSKAAEASENETVATETKTPEENPVEEATPVANEEIKTEETKEEVVAKQADTFVEKLETIEVEEGEEIDYKEAVTNLPQDAKLDVITPVDTKETGEKTTSAKITFADGSVKEIQIKVNVKAVEATEEAEDLELSEKVEKQAVKATESPSTGVRDAAPPEESEVAADANNAVHAYVGVVNGLNIDADLSKASDNQFKPIKGIKAYFQWFEKWSNGKEYSSPVYTATSGADGQLHMGIKSYIAEDGNLIRFDADTTVSAGNERYRFWIDESTIPEGYQLQYITGESVIFPDQGLPITQGGSGSNTAINIHGNWKILLMQKPLEQMHKKPTPTEIQHDGGYLTGKVGWDYKSGIGGIQWNTVADTDTPAKDVTVKASYLSDYALKQIYSDSTAVYMGVAKPSDIRGSGWTAEQEKKLQDWIKEKVKKDPDKWIAETVSAKTNADGKYIIQFKGTWGNLKNKDAGLKNYNYKEGDASSGQIWNRWTQDQIDRLGKVADKADNGRFDFSKAATNQVKHVNYDWLFVSIEGSENLRVMTPYNNNQYTQMSNTFGINSGWSGTGFGVGVTNAVPQILRADFALAPGEIKFNITNYDSGKNTAKVGDVAKTSTEGLPYNGESSENFRIVWYDEDGNKVQESLAQKPSSTGSLESADFDTSKVTKTTNYTAKLYRVDSAGKNAELLAQDSFTVVVEDSKKITSMYDEFEYKNSNPLKDATYSAKGLPDGLTIDPKTGDIKGVAKESGKFEVEVISVVPDESGDITASRFYTFTVTDSPLTDGNVGKEYNTKVEPKQIDGYVFKNVTAKFIDGKAIDGLTITGDQITGTPKTKVDATQEEPNVEVTYDIYILNEKGEEVLIKKGHVDRVPLSITEEAKDTTKPEIGDLDDDDDPKTPVAPKEDENNKGPQVWANGARVTEGKEITPIKVNVTDDTDKKPTVEVTGLPKGLSYNKETGKIEGTPDKLTNWADTEEERDFTVTIKAKDAAGNESTKEIQITILRDTDGDGIPDSTDPDDDNDGIKDEEDKNPKAWDANVNGKVETTVGTQPTVDQYKEKITNLPKGSEVKVKTEPDVSKAGETKAVVTVTLPNGEEVDVKVPVTVTDTTPAKPDAPTLKANDDGSVTVTPPADKDVDVVQITYTDEKNHQGTLVATKGDDGVWKLPDGTDPSIKIDPTTGVVTIPANQVKDGSEVKAIAQKGTEVSEVAKVNAKNNPVTKKEITKWVQETADGKIIELKKEDGNKSDNDGVSDIPGYEFVRTDKTEDDTTITYTNVYKLLLGSKAVGLDGKELKAATIGYVKENPEEFTGYTFLFDEAGNTPSDVEGKKVYVVNRIYAKNPEVVEVANPDSLTADEQNKVKEAVKAANPDLLDNQISVNEKGEVTITRGNQTAKLDPTLTVVKQGQTTAPKITQPKAGDKKITGTAEPGAKVEVELPDGTKVETTADGEGNWTAEVPKGKEPKEGETVKAVATVDGKTPSDEATATTGKADPTEAT
ncbi:Rib/alpha-like domain-containing protein, partial [Anaerococcus obesiensis]|uniref:Rib/alpha-like domain-containing protein n=1 Tax=Anaerococcus obesiensis TaxID=1287640 RepID=UPI0039946141